MREGCECVELVDEQKLASVMVVARRSKATGSQSSAAVRVRGSRAGAKHQEPRRLLQLHNKIQNSSQHQEHEDGMDLATTRAIESRSKRAEMELGIPSIPVT